MRSASVAFRWPASSTHHSDLRDGMAVMLPMLVAYVPFGLVVGAAVAASANPLAAWLSTMTIYGGAAHLAVLTVLAQGSGWVYAAAVGLLVNARLTAYATSMAPEWRTASVGRRILAALMLTDAPWAVARDRTAGRRSFYLGAGATLFVGWPTLVTLGALLGGWVDAIPVVAVLPPLVLGALVVPQLRHRPSAVAVTTASVCALLTWQASAGLSLALAGVVGGIAGGIAERVS